MKKLILDELLKEMNEKAVITPLSGGVYQLIAEMSATRYVLDVISVKNYGGHKIGHATKGFLIINRLERHCFVFNENASPGPGYIGEKLFPRGFDWKTDINNVWALVKTALKLCEWKNPLVGKTEV